MRAHIVSVVVRESRTTRLGQFFVFFSLGIGWRLQELFRDIVFELLRRISQVLEVHVRVVGVDLLLRMRVASSATSRAVTVGVAPVSVPVGMPMRRIIMSGR